MADEGLSGTAPVVPPPDLPGVQATPQTPPAQTPQPAYPSGGGKTPEQLSAELEEQANLLRESQERMARLEHENQLARQMFDNLTAGRAQAEEPPVPTVSDDEFLTNPAKATAKILEGYMAKERAEREREKQAQYIDHARRAFEAGRSKAVKEHEPLFKGIESTVALEMLNNVRDSFRAGQPVDVSVLEDPRYHLAAAVAMRIMNGDDISKYFTPRSNSPAPMAPAHTETPSGGAPPQVGMTLSPEQEELISRAGIKREQFIESMSKIRTAAQERNR